MNVAQKTDICIGCGMCTAICPSSAIQMQADEHGFLYPTVDAAKCTDCGFCIRKCPISALPQVSAHTNVLTGYAKDETLLPASSSGAIFRYWRQRSYAGAASCLVQRLTIISM